MLQWSNTIEWPYVIKLKLKICNIQICTQIVILTELGIKFVVMGHWSVNKSKKILTCSPGQASWCDSKTMWCIIIGLKALSYNGAACRPVRSDAWIPTQQHSNLDEQPPCSAAQTWTLNTNCKSWLAVLLDVYETLHHQQCSTGKHCPECVCKWKKRNITEQRCCRD